MEKRKGTKRKIEKIERKIRKLQEKLELNEDSKDKQDQVHAPPERAEEDFFIDFLGNNMGNFNKNTYPLFQRLE